MEEYLLLALGTMDFLNTIANGCIWDRTKFHGCTFVFSKIKIVWLLYLGLFVGYYFLLLITMCDCWFCTSLWEMIFNCFGCCYLSSVVFISVPVESGLIFQKTLHYFILEVELHICSLKFVYYLLWTLSCYFGHLDCYLRSAYLSTSLCLISWCFCGLRQLLRTGFVSWKRSLFSFMKCSTEMEWIMPL